MLLPLTLAVSVLIAPSFGQNTDINTKSGPIQGRSTETARIWEGIPYAQPPINNLRWSNPVPVNPWKDVKETTSFGPACPQICQLPPAACQAQISEDCLFLNVYAPKTATENAQVLVFFHGGRFEQGSEGVELYDGSNMANLTSSVVVTVNYRLGVLAFMTLPNITGNFGVLDQRLALHWIQDNIALFGGDPNQVTIFGQSAGASSVTFHLVSEDSFGLYNQAVMESSPFSLPLLTTEKAYDHYDHFVQETGCEQGDYDCLYALSWEEVAKASRAAEKKIYLNKPLTMFFPWTPVVDGKELKDQPITLFNQGQYNKVPTVLGNVAEEAYIFVFEAFPLLGRVEAEALVYAIFRQHHEPSEILSLYRMPKRATDYRPWLAVLASDFVIRCSTRNVSAALARDGVPVWRYEFNHSWTERGGWGKNYSYCEGHACHGVELPFVFDSAGLVGYSFTQAEKDLSITMATTWGTFAGQKTPNGPGLPEWSARTASNDTIIWYSTVDTQQKVDFRKEYCDFWDKFVYSF